MNWKAKMMEDDMRFRVEEEWRERFDNMAKQNNSLRLELDKISMDQEASEVAMKEAASKLAKRAQNAVDMERNIQVLNQNLDSLQSEKERILEKAKENEASMTQKINTLEDDRRSLKAEKDRMEEQLKERKAQLFQLKSRLQSTKARLAKERRKAKQRELADRENLHSSEGGGGGLPLPRVGVAFGSTVQNKNGQIRRGRNKTNKKKTRTKLPSASNKVSGQKNRVQDDDWSWEVWDVPDEKFGLVDDKRQGPKTLDFPVEDDKCYEFWPSKKQKNSSPAGTIEEDDGDTTARTERTAKSTARTAKSSARTARSTGLPIPKIKLKRVKLRKSQSRS